MTFIITDEDAKTVREALNWYNPSSGAMDAADEALAILDKLQRVETVGEVYEICGIRHCALTAGDLSDGASLYAIKGEPT